MLGVDDVANVDFQNRLWFHLILLSDTEEYKGDVSVLKQMTGGDALRGRIKFKQGAWEILVTGMVLIVGNYHLRSRDSSGAIARRMRPFPVNVISKSRVPLLSYHRNQWKGTLEKELPGIFNWAMDSNEDEARNYLVSTDQFVPSLVKELNDAKFTLDLLGQWVKEELEPWEGEIPSID